MTLDPNNYDFRHLEPDARLNKFRSICSDTELQQLKEIMIAINTWETQGGQELYRRAKKGTSNGRLSARKEIFRQFKEYEDKRMESGDPYMPHATAKQISNNGQGIYICDQFGNNIQMRPTTDDFQLNSLIIARPKMGKSSAVFHGLLQMLFLPLLIFDIKNIWRHRAQTLNAKVIQPPFYIDLEPPRGIKWFDWIFSVLDGLALITGLQYGVVPFIEAAKIALQQRDNYISHAQGNTSLSLMDIYYALDFVNLSGFKRDYILSCKAALQLIIGPNDLFSARSGIPLAEVFSGRYIIECCHLSMIQCRFLAFYFLNYLLQASYQCLEKIHLTRVVFLYVYSGFINRPDNAFGSAPSTGFWGHILSKLRGSGTGLIFADQLVEPIFDDVKQLCSNWIVIGAMSPSNEIIAAMNLTREQADYMGRMKSRECIAYFPNLYPRPIHGVIPYVASIAQGDFNE
jgi:hypothetical protein